MLSAKKEKKKEKLQRKKQKNRSYDASLRCFYGVSSCASVKILGTSAQCSSDSVRYNASKKRIAIFH